MGCNTYKLYQGKPRANLEVVSNRLGHPLLSGDFIPRHLYVNRNGDPTVLFSAMTSFFSTYSIRDRHISQILRTRYLQRHGFFFRKVMFNCLSDSRSHFNMAAFSLGAVSYVKGNVLDLNLLLLWFAHFFRLFALIFSVAAVMKHIMAERKY